MVKKLIENNSKANDVGAGLVLSQQNNNRPNANDVGADPVSAPKGITLIALIITIIILLILAGVTISLTMRRKWII